MRREATYLIELCRAHIDGDSVKLDKNIDYKKLYSLSVSHNLSALIFCVINNSENKDVVPKEVFTEFQQSFYDAVMRYDFQSAAIEETDRILSDSGIRHVYFKGAEIRELYPVPQVRVMGDVDLLLFEEDRDGAKKALTENGYALVNGNGPVYDYEKDGVRLEAHTRIISGKVGSSNAEEVMADAAYHAVFDAKRGRLDRDYHFAYLIAHIAHHFWFYGAGIRLILDLAVIQKNAEINLDRVFETLGEMSLDSFGKVMLSVCFKWFGYGKDFDVDTKSAEHFIMSYGVFGNSNRNRSAVIQRKELEEGKSSSAFSTRLRLLFPPYSKLKDIPYIRFIEGRPYLTPLAWGYRLLYNIKNRREFVKNATKDIGSDESKKQAQEELEFFKEIGL